MSKDTGVLLFSGSLPCGEASALTGSVVDVGAYHCLMLYADYTQTDSGAYPVVELLESYDGTNYYEYSLKSKPEPKNNGLCFSSKVACVEYELPAVTGQHSWLLPVEGAKYIKPRVWEMNANTSGSLVLSSSLSTF